MSQKQKYKSTHIRAMSLLMVLGILNILVMSCNTKPTPVSDPTESRIDSLLSLMTLDEKIGQMLQKNGPDGHDEKIREGQIGSILNTVDVNAINRLQKIAVEESRLGIPIIFARDVIHGFNTILPIPLGQAAAWNPELIESGTRMSAIEARSSGIRWTFAPMIDITRDPRWGRIAESFGEDPFLTSTLGAAAIKGYQGNYLDEKNSIAACAKHFAAYGAAEAGRDYHTVAVPENDLRDIYLPSFKAAVDADVATLMTAFNEINGIPASGNELLTKQILRQEWDFKGMVVSDWSSIQQLVVHGYAEDNRDAGLKAINARVDMEMASTCYEENIKDLLDKGEISLELIDESVRNILRLKFKMGLFENPYTNPNDYPEVLNEEHLKVAKQAATESLVLLKNDKQVLPLSKDISSVAVIGPLSDQAHDQLGTWVFDGKKENSVTPLQSIREFLGDAKVNFAPGLEISRTMNRKGFEEAIKAAKKSEVIVLFLGEESILSGESHCRADITLPGIQTKLIEALAETGKPIVAVVMAGRPLTFEPESKYFDALIYAWHPGTMAGPAISDVLFGIESPSGKLPVTFPRTVGQIPVYYSQKNSGKPAADNTWEKMDDIPHEAFQLSIGNTNHYLDYGFKPWFSFGYGLSYTTFEYSDIAIDANTFSLGDSITFSATITNTGEFAGKEVAQLYIRDLVGSRTRPVKELKGFQKVFLNSGESKKVSFKIHTNQLGFHNQEMKYVTEPGLFKAGIGSNSNVELTLKFKIN